MKNICYIKKVLENHSYIPSKYHIFVIHELKVRLVMSQNMIDKMVKRYVLELDCKTKIINSKMGMIFLGYRFIFVKNKLHIRVRKEIIKRFKNKTKYFNKINEYEKLVMIKANYHGYFKYMK